MKTVAVIAHTGKSIGGGLDELRRLITSPEINSEEIGELLWYEVPKSRKAPKKLRKALADGAELVFVWGGDGMVQRCIDTVVTEGSDAVLAIIPAGTANLFARNLGIPIDLEESVRTGWQGRTKRLDVGRINGEHFGVMAGIGFDADMIDDADGTLKDRLGRLAYLWTGAREVGAKPVRTKVKLDGTTWFDGSATCVLVGNVAKVFGSVAVFDDAVPDDGWLDVGVTTAHGAAGWTRTFLGIGTGTSDDAPHVRTARARRISVKLGKPRRFELDGGSRTKVVKAKVKVVPDAVSIRVPAEASNTPQPGPR